MEICCTILHKLVFSYPRHWILSILLSVSTCIFIQDHHCYSRYALTHWRGLDVSNAFQDTNVIIHERVCVIQPDYYLEQFKNPILMVLSISITVHLVSNIWMVFRVKIHQFFSEVESLKEWLRLWNTIESQLIMSSTFSYFLMLLSPI